MSDARDQSIDVFRGIAILLVVLFHFTARLPPETLNISGDAPWKVPFGWVGVNFFFVISGYCIALTLERSSTVGQFLARRVSRIYPAFVAAVLLLFLFQLVAPVPSSVEAHYRVNEPGLFDVVLNLLFVGEVGEWVNGSFWSIAVEVKFYAFFALLAVLIVDRVRLTIAFTWISLGMAGLYLLALTLQPGNHDATSIQSLLKFLTVAPYLPFFALGILGRQRAIRSMPTGGYLAAVTIACVLMVYEMADFDMQQPLMLEPFLDAGVFLVLAMLFLNVVDGRPLWRIPLLTPALASLGLVSYSWYLVHETLGYSLMASLNLVLPPLASLALDILATLLVAWGFSRVFEWRFRKPVEQLVSRLMRIRPFGVGNASKTVAIPPNAS